MYKYIYIDIYRIDVLVFIGSKEELFKFLKKSKTEKSLDEIRTILNEERTDGMNTVAQTLNIQGSVLIFSEKPITRKTLVHECAHATRIILENIGAYPSDNDEPYAYLIEYLYDKAESLCATSS